MAGREMPSEVEILAFLQRKYTHSADARQAAMGLCYINAETHDLAKELHRFLATRPTLQPAAIAEARREGMESAAQKCQDFAACFFNGTAAQAALIAAANMIRTDAATAAQKEGEA